MMAKYCMAGCQRKERIHDYNYAGFKISEGDHAFPGRVSTEKTIPGSKNSDYLCDDCISEKYPVICKVHGPIKNQKYAYGKPPICEECKKELEQIKKGHLPHDYLMRMPLTFLTLKSGKTFENAIFVISKDQEAHFVIGGFEFSDQIENIDFSLEENYMGDLSFILKPKKIPQINTCKFTIETSGNISDLSGMWINPWIGAINTKLGIIKGNPEMTFCSVEHHKLKNGDFGYNKKRKPFCFIAIQNDKITTFPDMNLPRLYNLHSWKIKKKHINHELALNFTEDKILHQIIITNEYFGSLNSFSKKLPVLKKPKGDLKFGIEKQGVLDVEYYPNYKTETSLIELTANSIKSQIELSKEAKIYPFGFIYKNKCLMVSDDGDYGVFKIPSALKDQINKIFPDFDYKIVDKNCQLRFFFGMNPIKPTTLAICNNYIVLENKKKYSYDNLENITVKEIGQNLARLTATIRESKENIHKSLVGPSGYIYTAWELLEVNKAKYSSKDLTTPELYKRYHELKKQNLLIGLFSNIMLLNSKLNEDISMAEVSQYLSQIDSEKFFNDKTFNEKVIQKLLLLSISIEKIKQDYEYLSSFYPYYQFKNELDLIEKGFGPKIAKSMQNFERRRIVSNSRKNVQGVQIKLQRCLSEIERALSPVEQIFEKNQIKKSLFSNITKYFPHAAQVGLVGIMATVGGLTGGVAVLAGMLGIKMLHDLLRDIQNDREAMARVKKSAEKTCSWWQILNDTFPVILYETSDQIDMENEACMERDKNILLKIPEEKRPQIIENLNNELKRQISDGTKNRFVEILEGTGVRFRSMVDEIETTIQIDLNKNVERALDTLLLPKNN